MTGRLRGFALATTMVLAACGGTPAATAPVGGTAAPGPTSGSGQQSSAPVTNPPAATPGGNSGGSGTVFTGDPCSLLTAAELEQVTGLKGATGESMAVTNGSGGCHWKVPDDVAADIFLVTGPDALTAAASAKAEAPAADVLPGIGDWAAWDSESNGVLLVKGVTVVGVRAGPVFADAATKKENSIALAKLIAAKL